MDIFYFLGNGTAIKNIELLELLSKNHPLKPMSQNTKDLLLNYILDSIGVSELNNTNKKIVQNAIYNFCTITSRLWLKCALNSKNFRRKHIEWLNKIIITTGGTPSSSTVASAGPGRPRKSFHDLTDKIKRRKLNSEVQSKSKEELC